MSSSLPAQPYEVKDFAGGLTENFIAGGPTRYMAADNFLVTVDRKLEERYGSQLLASPNYQLPSGNTPVNALIAHDNQAYLLGVPCPNVYVLNPNWTGILGPTGNPPLTGGNYLNQVSWDEWSHHTVMTNDSLATSPVKIFRGAGYPTTMASPPTNISSFMAVTAGLPALTSQQNISNSALLSACILLANDLKTNLISHMQDVGSIGTNLHQALDTGDIATLTGAPNAVDQASLFTLCTALISAYQSHVNDVINNFFSPTWHFATIGIATPLNFFLTSVTTPTTLTQAGALLDDLKTKFLMHELAPFTHDIANNYATIGKHLVTTAHIGTVSTGPVLTPSYTQSLALANNMKAVFNAHIADTTYHIIADTTDTITLPDAIDLDTLYIMIVYLRVSYVDHWNDSDVTHNLATATTTASSKSLTSVALVGGGPYAPGVGVTIWDSVGTVFPKSSQPVTVTASGAGTATASVNAAASETSYQLDFTAAKYHIAQTTNQLNETLGSNNVGQFFTYNPTASNLQDWLSLLTQVVSAYNEHDTNFSVHLTAGIHTTSAPTPTIASYAYALHYFYQYMRYDGVIFNVVGPPVYLGPVQTEAITPSYQTLNPSGGSSITVAASTLTISNIPTLANGGQFNYDTANVQVKIFRTINAGSTYYQTGIVTNGTSTFTDTTPDVINPLLPATTPLTSNPTIYTSGGVVNFDPAPVCKYITIMQNTAYYAAIIDTGQTFLNRIRQSIQNNIDSSPGSFFLDLPDVIMGISNTRNIVVAFCANSVYQISGGFNQLGQGQMSYQSISDTIGCVSGNSIVRTDVGIFFAGTDGFYYTDGYQLIKLSSELNLTYASLVSNAQQRRVIYGCYDRYNRRVWWSVQGDPSDWSAKQSYVFHVNFGVNAAGVFTTCSNLENYRPSAMIFWQGQQYRGDARGYLFLHSSQSQTDPQVNLQVTPTSWNTAYIPYNYSSCAVDFGTTFNRKWLTRFSMQGKNVGNVGALVTSWSDNGRVPPLALSPIWFHPNIQWGYPKLIWGAPNSLQPITWGAKNIGGKQTFVGTQLDMWRRFPATQLRADYKQIIIKPAYIGVYRYQDWPTNAAASITPNGNGTASIQILTPTGYTAIVWPSDVVGYNFASQLDNFVAEYPITALATTTNTNDTIVVSDPNNELIITKVAWVLRGYLKQQRISITSYNIHFTLLGKMQQAYHGIQDSGENVPGTQYQISGGDPLTDDSGDALTDDSGNPLTS